MNNLTINVRAATGETVRKIQNVADASRALSDTLAAFDGDVKSVFRAYLALGMHKDPAAKGGLKTLRQMSSDLGEVVSKATVRRYLLEIDPELHAEIAAAHPITR
jgi:hypothetical protein